MKKIIILVLLFLPQIVNTQIIRGYGTINTHLTGGFERKSIVNFGVGLELKVFEFLRTEIEASYYLGTLENIETTNSDYVATNFLTRYVTAINYSLSPKFLIDISQEDDIGIVYLQIIPKYNLTNITAKGSFFSLNNNNSGFNVTDSDTFNEIRRSFGIGFGIMVKLLGNRSDSFAFNLYYNNVDIGNAINKLKFSTTSLKTNNAIGVGINYYFGFIKKKK